jgi:aryl-alcohol dehydrogenase-like predicted oxidoreductase
VFAVEEEHCDGVCVLRIDKSIEAYYELMTMGFTDDLMRKAVVMYPGSTTERAEYCMEAMKFSKK